MIPRACFRAKATIQQMSPMPLSQPAGLSSTFIYGAGISGAFIAGTIFLLQLPV